MADINKAVKIFELSLACDSTGLYIDSSSPNDKKKATRVLNQFQVDADTYDKVQTFFSVMDRALLKLMKE